MAVPECPIIILGAGAASRMRGRDKLLEPVEGMPLIRRQAQMARHVTTGPVIVALPPKPHPRYAALQGLDNVTCLAVTDAAEGMNASLRAAFAALPMGTPCAMVLLGDLPALTMGDLNEVLQAVDLKSDNLIWRGATQQGAAGHPIVFHADLFPAIANLTGDSGGRELAATAVDRTKLVPLPDTHARLDLDTPEEWDNWHRNKDA